MRGLALSVCFGAALLAASSGVLAADSVPTRIEAGRAAHARGDLARAAAELEAALAELHARLGRLLAEFMPSAPPGWQAEAAETMPLSGSGGGLAVTRAYSMADGSLNASLIIDSPAVAAAAGQFAAGPSSSPNAKRIRLGNEDALLRWDAANQAGEITIVLGSRAVLQIDGDGLATGELLVEAARGWNVPAIRKILGLGAT
ncbi:hypothetical protein [Magnetospirillum sp. SS-4]|uniref:hypothetical protein n=1 Tax=Magnetospirillum sp. SS-4 TaxID=2681465 RepID=UPI0013851A6B|nr:hypothetical protein [Magnetospirillum sp. SS-4]CAA7619829.1 conserved exported hypothetical protein [Magnetospirillum sp. SS-4]